jgi:hypothetical protein
MFCTTSRAKAQKLRKKGGEGSVASLTKCVKKITQKYLLVKQNINNIKILVSS